MGKMEHLIKTYCPNGIEYKELDKIIDILDNRRKPVTKKNREAGIYPYYGANGIQDYVNDYLFDGEFVLVGEDGSVINKDNSPVVTWAEGKIWVNNHAHVLTATNTNLLKYVFYYLQTIDVQKIVRGTPPKLNQKSLRQIKIPVPPIEIQNEIIMVLDKLTELNTQLLDELKNEIDVRKKQYEYYRKQILTFNT